MPNELEQFQFGLIEIEGQVGKLIGSARIALAEAQEEINQLRQKIDAAEIKFFTEAEFAEKLRVSAATIARLRKDGEIPHLLVRGCCVYTSDHLLIAAQRFERPAWKKRFERPASKKRPAA